MKKIIIIGAVLIVGLALSYQLGKVDGKIELLNEVKQKQALKTISDGKTTILYDPKTSEIVSGVSYVND